MGMLWTIAFFAVNKTDRVVDVIKSLTKVPMLFWMGLLVFSIIGMLFLSILDLLREKCVNEKMKKNYKDEEE